LRRLPDWARVMEDLSNGGLQPEQWLVMLTSKDPEAVRALVSETESKLEAEAVLQVSTLT
jgi:hypothetical protein